MTSFQYERASDVSARFAAGARAGRAISWRRHQSRRPHARDHRASRCAGGRDRPLPRYRGDRRRGLADRRWREEHRRRGRSACARALSRCSPRRSWPAPRRRSVTWRRSAAISCSAPAASISTTTPRAATSALPERAATRETASIATTPSSAPLRAASPRTPLTCASPLRLWTRS